MMTRRQFLKAGAIAGSGFLVSLGHSGRAMASPSVRSLAAPLNPAALTRFTEPLFIPPLVDATGGGTFNLPMAPGMWQFHSSLAPAPTWGYGGAPILGPTFVAMRGVPILVNATNQLTEHPVMDAIDTTLHGAVSQDRTSPRVSLHLHGGNTEPQSDGFPEDTFLPLPAPQHAPYDYNNDQEATTLWYHDHALGITRLNVYAGLAGFYLLRDSWDTGQAGNGPDLPFGYGTYEIPLVIQDRMLDADGRLFYPTTGVTPAHPIWQPEFFGDIALVNGRAWPNLNVDRGVYRFRILNGSNSRFYDLSLRGGAFMYQIGTDGALLNAPVRLTSLLIAPGERADVLIDFSRLQNGVRVVVANNAPAPFPSGKRHGVGVGAVPLTEIMQFTVGANLTPFQTIPTTLRPSPIASLTAPAVVRNLVLAEILDEAGEPVAALLNNLFWGNTSQIETPTVDTVEQWNLINTTGDSHPIHLHLPQFQILGRQKFNVAAYTEAFNAGLPDPSVAGVGPWPPPSADPFVRGPLMPPAPNEKGWKDTVQAHPGEITRLLVPFGAGVPGVPFGNSFTGEYVWHCHILEHEDNEMMLRYRVQPASAATPGSTTQPSAGPEPASQKPANAEPGSQQSAEPQRKSQKSEDLKRGGGQAAGVERNGQKPADSKGKK